MITTTEAPVSNISSKQYESIPWKVLVVDDESAIRRIVAFRLKQNGYQVSTATNGVEALEFFNVFC